jgi:MFS family permease
MVRLGWIVSLLVLLVALPARDVGAEDELKVGAQVRVTTLASTLAGTLAAITDQAIAVGRNDERVEVPWAEVKKLEVMNPGRKAHTALLTVGGALAGAATGAIAVGGAAAGCVSDCPTDEGWSNAFKTAAIVGAVLGAVGGFVTARLAVRRDPYWEEIEHRPRVRINVIPVRGRGVGLAVSLAF